MKLTYISILRSLSILTVVFFHIYQYMYVEAHFPATISMYHDTYFWFNQCVGINIAMPMFTLIAGYLFDYLYDRGKYRELWPMVKKKMTRLLLPFFVFGILMMASPSAAPFEPWKLLGGGYGHLWYLTTLFWCFPLAWVIKKYVSNVWGKTGILAVFLLLASQDVSLPPMLGLHGITGWFGWFMLGEMIASYQDAIFGAIRRYRLAVPLLVPFAVQAWFAPVEYGDKAWYLVLCTALVLVGIVYVFANAGGVILKVCQPLVWLSKYSFGLYIFHYWVGPYLISSTAKRLFSLERLAADHVVLFPLLLTLAIIAISWVLTWALLKTRVGRMLIG